MIRSLVEIIIKTNALIMNVNQIVQEESGHVYPKIISSFGGIEINHTQKKDLPL